MKGPRNKYIYPIAYARNRICIYRGSLCVLRDPKKNKKQKRTEEQAHLRAIGVDPLRAAPFSHPLFKTAHHHHHRWLFNHYFFFVSLF